MLAGFPQRALVAHRGLAERMPENSLPALAAAVEAGVTLVEFDLQLTRDGVPVLMHDAGLERTTGRAGDVRDLALTELDAVRAGYPARFDGRFPDVRVPTLTEAVAMLEPPALALVEVKGESVERFGLACVMAAVLAGIEPLRKRAMVISFVPEVVQRARAAGWPGGLCLETHTNADRALAEKVGAELLLVDEVHLHTAADIWPGPWRVGCWEVTTVTRALELFDLGVAYVESMLPEVLLADRRVTAVLDAARQP